MSFAAQQPPHYEEASTIASNGTTGDASSGGFGVMGGNMGDSYVASPHQPTTLSTPQQQAVQQQPPTTPGSGSITQFAAAQQTMYGVQPQQQMYGHAPLQQYSSPQPYGSPTPNRYGMPSTTQLAAPQAQQHQPPAQYRPQPATPAQYVGQNQDQQIVQSNHGMHSPPPQQQACGSSVHPSAAPPKTPQTAGGYAARSAAAFAASGGVAQQQQQQQQQQAAYGAHVAHGATPSVAPSTASTMTASMAVPPQPPMTGMPQQHPSTVAPKANKYAESPAAQAQQNRILTDCTRKVQENSYYMKQAMESDDIPNVLDRASQMLGELGDGVSSSLTPKNYYELHMRALDDMSNLEEYFFSLVAAAGSDQQAKFSAKQLYGEVQFCPKVLPRLYLQICAGSALIRSGDATPQWVLQDLIEYVKSVQNPIRGLFLRHYLLQVTRDKLPDKEQVKDGYEFVLANFIEMNKLWVRLQHLPGEGKTKEQRKKRERERNELRILVGTNLVRLSQLEGVDGKIYGEIILPKILEQIIVCGDPLAQAYLIDCIIQVFPDENHIETLPVLLDVCPKLRDKVNIRTILQSLMDRLANYYADGDLLDEADKNQVKKTMAKDSYPLFEACVQKVYQARGPKLNPKEVIRLQTALMKFSLRCYRDDMEQVNRALGACADLIRQITSGFYGQAPAPLDEASAAELEKMLMIPLESMSLKVQRLENYNGLFGLLPYSSRRKVGMSMLRSIVSSGQAPPTAKELEELFALVAPIIQGEQQYQLPNQMMPGRLLEMQEENAILSKLVHTLRDERDPDSWFGKLTVARNHLSAGGPSRTGEVLPPIVYAALKLVKAVFHFNADDQANVEASMAPMEQEAVGVPEESAPSAKPETKKEGETSTESTQETETEKEEDPETKKEDEENEKIEAPASEPEKVGKDTEEAEDVPTSTKKRALTVDCRAVFVFLQTTISMLSKTRPEVEIKMNLDAALTADRLATFDAEGNASNFPRISYELLSQAFILYEEEVTDSKSQQRCILDMAGTLQACEVLSDTDYQSLITKIAQYSARMVKKQDQCKLVAACAHLFYPGGSKTYQNAQRSLECLQRCLKIADACTSASPANVFMFVDLLEDYVDFFEKKNPSITAAYISGLIALIREHLDNAHVVQGADVAVVAEAKAHFAEILQYIRRKKMSDEDRFVSVNLES